MARKINTTLFVIFVSPEHRGGPGTRYLTKDGKSTTEHRSEAAGFFTFLYALTFAKENGITLDARTYIGQEDFSDFDLLACLQRPVILPWIPTHA